MSRLRVSHLTCGYEDRVVLRDVSFELKAGEVLAFIGPNGAGKIDPLQGRGQAS
jgi:ABC-type multidrug transport system ATPase subunit